jgi:hypothetical protein
MKHERLLIIRLTDKLVFSRKWMGIWLAARVQLKKVWLA